VVKLNRAVAVAMSGAVDQGLAMLDELEQDGRLAGYHLLAAARADLLRRRGDRAGATASYELALELVTSDAERRFLARRLAEVRAGRSE
jgi:RNA polymerase sigma-70 factor (ECF subfamily)